MDIFLQEIAKLSEQGYEVVIQSDVDEKQIHVEMKKKLKDGRFWNKRTTMSISGRGTNSPWYIETTLKAMKNVIDYQMNKELCVEMDYGVCFPYKEQLQRLYSHSRIVDHVHKMEYYKKALGEFNIEKNYSQMKYKVHMRGHYGVCTRNIAQEVFDCNEDFIPYIEEIVKTMYDAINVYSV